MTKTPQEIIIAALVAKLGGRVDISDKEYADAEDLDLMRLNDPTAFGISFKVQAPPVVVKGEVVNEPPGLTERGDGV